MDDSNSTSYQYTTIDRTSTTSRSGKRRASSSYGRPGTARPSTAHLTIGLERHRVVCAINESRGVSPTVGLAFINLDTAEGILCQISDSQTYARTVNKLVANPPSVLLIPETAIEAQSRLVSALDEGTDVSSMHVVSADRKFWSEKVGLDHIDQLALREDVNNVRLAAGDNFYAVCCLASALKYIEIEVGLQWPPHCLRLRYETSEGSISIDAATIRSLELIQNANDAKSKECLFGMLNQTSTPMGCRLLRSTILQPMTDRDVLMSRWDALEELTTREDIYASSESATKEFLDVDKVLSDLILVPKEQTLHTTEQSVNHVLALKYFLTAIGPIYDALTGSKGHILKEVRQRCAARHYREALDLINDAVNPDTIWAKQPVDLRNQRSYAVKEGFNPLLDVARRTYSESNQRAIEYVQELSTEHNLALELKFDHARQYYIRLPIAEIEDRTLPPIFINVFRKGKYIECSTLDLKKLNQRIAESHNETLMMGDRVIQELIDALRALVPSLFKISESIALLDMTIAFAKLVMDNGYVRPEFNEILALKTARHPVKELHQYAKFVPNDIFATQTRRFQIVTGCNMSGKSTYIRSVAMCCIMAQIGCFVPAQLATVPIVRQILARVATDDSIEANVSTFSAEMRDAAYIIDNVGKDSLVLIDELGRGTSTRDGMAIALAIAEALVSSRAYVWFVTHFRDLAKIMAERPGVTSLHLAVDTSQESTVSMLYRVADGVEKAEHYGLMMAKVLPFPPGVIEKAEEVAHDLQQRAERKKKTSQAVIVARRRRLVLSLREQLQQAYQGRMSDAVLADWLQQLQKDFVVRMVQIDEDARVHDEDVDEAMDDTMDEIESVRSEQVVRSSQSRSSRTHPGAGGVGSRAASSSSMLFDV